MDPELYKAVKTCNIANLQKLLGSNLTLLLQKTRQGDNILHIAAKYDLKKIAEEIIKPQLTKTELCVQLVTEKNSKGDTPLHIAARFGSLETAQILINCGNSMRGEIEAGERLISMVNMEKDTALHDAARNGHFQIAEMLIKDDPGLALSTNDIGESPLFIAVDKKHVNIAKVILEVAPSFSYGGRSKMNALHAAVVRSQDEVFRLSSYMVKLQNPMDDLTYTSIKHVFKVGCFVPCTIIRAAFRYSTYEDSVKFLTANCQPALRESDEYGWTPLHYAVHFGALGIVKLFLKYNIDSTAANARDKQGMSIIHIAAGEGEVAILTMLASRYPEIWDIQDDKGQTALHLAVARGKMNSVKFILGNNLSHSGLINQQDNEGNTALHLAVIQDCHRKIFELLIKDRRVDKTVTNKEGLTVIDLLLLKEYGYYEKVWILCSVAINGGTQSLEQAFNKNGRKTRSTETIRELEQPQGSERREPASVDTPVGVGQRQVAIRKADAAVLKRASRGQLREISSTNLLVTTLIATVSFAAGLTVPGGFKSGGTDEGMAILSRKNAFRAFVIADALAFCFSTASMYLHYITSLVEKLDALLLSAYIDSLLAEWGISAMVVAFISGTYATLGDSPGLAIAVLSIGCSFFGLTFLINFM